MKYLKHISLLIASIFVMASCTLDIDKSYLLNESEFVAPLMQAMGDVIGTADNVKTESVTYNWNRAEFGVPVQTLYQVYAEYTDNEQVVHSALLGQSFTTSITLLKGDLMGVLCNDAKVPKNEKHSVNTYVVASINGTTTASIKSNVISYNVTTFIAPKRSLTLPGNYQGWSQWGNEFWETDGGTNIYKTLVNVIPTDDTQTNCYFKVNGIGNEWMGFSVLTPGWTLPDPAQGDGNFSILKTTPINIISVNMAKKTIDKETVTAVTLIGSFDECGWDDTKEVNFTYDPTNNVWVTTAVTFSGANTGFLVRLNKSWDYKYGNGTVASEEVTNGVLIEKGASDINVPSAGKYIMTLHGNRTPFVLIMTKQ